MTRVILTPLALLALMGSSAHGQFNFVGPGSTAEGDYLRGVGVAALGIGIGSHQMAIANSINADTAIRINEYIYGCLMNENRMNAEHRADMARKAKEEYNKIRERIAQHPEARDVRKGDSLNVVLEELNNPKIQEGASSSNAVPLTVDEVRRIPFKLGAKGVKRFSIARLTAKGKGKWPVAFQDNRFDHERRQFEKALDNALEQQYKSDMQLQSIKAVQKTIDDLESRLEQVVGKIADKLYFEARERLKEMRETVEMLKATDIERALGELDRYAGTTVNDLRVFMLRHNLQFADADNPEERELFPQLYAKLGEQRDRVSQGLAVQDDAPKN
ncbi:MAG: hypothetical protein ACLQU5_14510 [Isosphaeraceae bacterium]